MILAPACTGRGGNPRRTAVAQSPRAIGLDFVEIERGDGLWVLRLHFIPAAPGVIKPVLPAGLVPSQVRLSNGPGRLPTGLRALRILPGEGDVLPVEAAFTAAPESNDASPVYNLRLAGVPDLDPLFQEASFALDVDVPSALDPRRSPGTPPPPQTGPVIDYLAKDYESFRGGMLDRLAALQTEWTERNPADLGIALVEILAYAGDHLSYYQDAAATEAYLLTARERVSVRRHARLLDYQLSEGSNARAWVVFEVADGAGGVLPRGTRLITRTGSAAVVLRRDDLRAVLDAGARIFETLSDETLRAAHNAIPFYTWDGAQTVLPRGATRTTLDDAAGLLQLAPFDVLVLEEVRSPTSGRPEDADPARRHAVRLLEVKAATDPLLNRKIVEVTWGEADALPFDLRLGVVHDAMLGGRAPVSLARGNAVLADQGVTLPPEDLGVAPEGRPFRPVLREPVAWQGHVLDGRGQPVLFDPEGPASGALRWAPGDALPAVVLHGGGGAADVWRPRRDLLASGRFDQDFTVEVRNDGRAQIRFGNGQNGRRPEPGTRFTAVYRVGNGQAGNVGHDTIRHLLEPVDGLVIRSLRNPLPAVGGREPEPLGDARDAAPEAFRQGERAVTRQDYADLALRHPEVRTARSEVRWTGSWYTAFVTVARSGGRPVDEAFRRELQDWLAPYRLAGSDLEVQGPRFVPLDIALRVGVLPGYLAEDVRAALTDAFTSGYTRNGQPGFFHPDRWTFGEPVYLNLVLGAALGTPGVADVAALRFRGANDGRKAEGPPANLHLPMGDLEIAQVLSDPARPADGRIDFEMRGER